MMTIGHGVVTQHDDTGDGRSAQLEIDMSTYWYHYAGRATDAKVEALVIEGAGPGSATTTAAAPRSRCCRCARADRPKATAGTPRRTAAGASPAAA
ncbi:MAG: hypothetical protein IPH44_13685 [Myxococcales bacterium]|nr:hypothetical protein [Myxococcales bacterium]